MLNVRMPCTRLAAAKMATISTTGSRLNENFSNSVPADRPQIEGQIIRLVFFGAFLPAFLGIALWGINKVAQDTLFKAAITGLIPLQRSSASGIFDTAFGVRG